MVFLTAKQRVLVVLLREGPLQNSHIAKKAGVTEQYCSKIVESLRLEGLLETKFAHPRHISKLTSKGVEVAKPLTHVAGLNVNQT